jgi:hypothetical protein
VTIEEEMKNVSGETKITVKLFAPGLADLNKTLDRLCVKRDGFLNMMIETELPNLASDLKGKRNSPEARLYISRALKRVGLRQINLVVSKKVARDLNALVETHNLVRDAFMNALVLFLRSSDKLLDWLDLPRVVNGSTFSSVGDPFPTSPLQAIESVYADPLFYIRLAVEERMECGLYELALPHALHGFSCYLPDILVPGTKAHKEMSHELLDLGAFEASAFKKKHAETKKEGAR